MTTAQWKILIVDDDSQKLINNVVKEDDILNLNITSTRLCMPSTHPMLTPQTSSASRSDGRRYATWTPYTSSLPSHTLSTA
jgi:hypothetical protein